MTACCGHGHEPCGCTQYWAEELLASQEVLSSIELVREVLNDGHVYCFQLTNSAIRLRYMR
jgi:cephalosporin-C deacetylase-like acetyl esterase